MGMGMMRCVMCDDCEREAKGWRTRFVDQHCRVPS
jgi:hypothetical protein